MVSEDTSLYSNKNKILTKKVANSVTQTKDILTGTDTICHRKGKHRSETKCYIDILYNCFDSSSDEDKPLNKKPAINMYPKEEQTVVNKYIGNTCSNLNVGNININIFTL